MDELINAIVLCFASMVVGAILHSAGGHAGYNQRVRAWIERNLLAMWKSVEVESNCRMCGAPVPLGDVLCEACVHWLREWI